MGALAITALVLVAFVTVLGGKRPLGCGEESSSNAGAGATALPAGALGLGGLGEDQLRNAKVVLAEGRRAGVSDQGIVAALATALQESGLRNYANDGHGGDLGPDQRGIAASLRLPHQAVGTDHGSLGIFQQQWPWWGSMRELMDPATAASKFYASLKRVRGWETLPVTVAAQTVQRSAYPSAYADDEATARDLLAKLGGSTGVVEGSGGGSRTHAVTAGYQLGSVRPQLTAMVSVVGPKFGVRSVGGYRTSARDPGGHPSGLAADFMTSSREQGDRLAAYAQAHADELGIDYIIWRQRIWSAARAAEGWRAMADRGGVTENHFDHVHINVRPDATVTAEATTADLAAPTEDCVEVPPALIGGDVVFPLPPGTVHTDRANWGRAGSRWARQHTGTDLSAPCGTPVLAAHAGTVMLDTSQSWAGRWLVKVSTGPGSLTTWYAHMQKVTVAAGQQVQPGQQLGEVGAEGNATGCHLHLEVHPRGGSIYADNVNPTAWLGRRVGRRLGGGSAGGVVTAVAAGTAPPPAGTRLTVLSWNIRFGQFGVANIADAIHRYDADIIGLNEVDAFGSGGSQARDLASRLGMYMAYGPNKSWGSKQRGNAILSRWPLGQVTNTRLPMQQGREPRGLLHAYVDLGGRTVSVYVTHLDFGGQVRQAQAHAVARAVGATGGCPTWLLGDMNFAPLGNPGMYRTLTRHLADPYASGAYGRGATAPAPNPRGRIDYALQAGATTIGAAVMPRGPSDHRAVRTVNVVPLGASCT